mmetsp:Transcript_42239/g.99075  ORF Transcript_42239/g.99075 Transcript_42239/m.99075 type:complete len:207 (+) Transcript_42239:210-830(+)
MGQDQGRLLRRPRRGAGDRPGRPEGSGGGRRGGVQGQGAFLRRKIRGPRRSRQSQRGGGGGPRRPVRGGTPGGGAPGRPRPGRAPGAGDPRLCCCGAGRRLHHGGRRPRPALQNPAGGRGCPSDGGRYCDPGQDPGGAGEAPPVSPAGAHHRREGAEGGRSGGGGHGQGHLAGGERSFRDRPRRRGRAAGRGGGRGERGGSRESRG